jgi:hypothetical protein
MSYIYITGVYDRLNILSQYIILLAVVNIELLIVNPNLLKIVFVSYINLID